MKTAEVHYTVRELATQILKQSSKTIVARIKEGAFGLNVVNLSGNDQKPDYRVPASGVNLFLKSREFFPGESDPGVEGPRPGVVARTEGELRRKAA